MLTLKEVTEVGEREDFRKNWESFSLGWGMSDEDGAHQEYFLKANGEAEWARLDISLDEWIGQRELNEEDQGDEEEDEEEEEGEGEGVDQ